MRDWLNSLRKEARALAIFAPLLAISALLGLEAAKTQAADRYAQSPVSPLPGQNPPAGTIVLGLESNYWALAILAIAILIVIGIVWWRRQGV